MTWLSVNNIFLTSLKFLELFYLLFHKLQKSGLMSNMLIFINLSVQPINVRHKSYVIKTKRKFRRYLSNVNYYSIPTLCQSVLKTTLGDSKNLCCQFEHKAHTPKKFSSRNYYTSRKILADPAPPAIGLVHFESRVVRIKENYNSFLLFNRFNYINILIKK